MLKPAVSMMLKLTPASASLSAISLSKKASSLLGVGGDKYGGNVSPFGRPYKKYGLPSYNNIPVFRPV